VYLFWTCSRRRLVVQHVGMLSILVQQIKQMEFGLSRDGAALGPNSITLQITMKASYIRHSARTFIAVCLADGAITAARRGAAVSYSCIRRLGSGRCGEGGAFEPYGSANALTRHRASTSMYSLTFSVRFLLPERHQWKPAVQTAAVMLRTPPSAAGRPRPLPVYAARGFGGAPRRPAVAGRWRAQTPPSRPFALCRHIAGWTQACN